MYQIDERKITWGWLENVPDYFADMLKNNTIDYKTFLKITKQYRKKERCE